MMEIQQHDGVVVEAAGFQQGFAKRYWRRKRCHGREREAPGLRVRLPSLPSLYIGARRCMPPWISHLEGGALIRLRRIYFSKHFFPCFGLLLV